MVKSRKLTIGSMILILSVLFVMIFSNKAYSVEAPSCPSGDLVREEGIFDESLSDELTDMDELLGGTYASLGEEAYWRQFRTDYFYNQLSAQERQLWDNLNAVCEGYLNGSVSATYKSGNYLLPAVPSSINLNTNKDVRKKISELFKYSNPQYYFLSTRYYYNSTSMSLCVYPNFSSRESMASTKVQFRERVDKFLNLVDTNTYPEQIERQIHDLIANNVTYVSNDLDQSAWSSLINGRTVCAGYTKAMTLLGRACGLDVIPVVGLGNGGAHAWNMIRIHNNWYLLDVTWDDTDGKNGRVAVYNFYNISKYSDGKHQPSTYQNDEYDLAGYLPDYIYDSVVPGYDYESPYFYDDNYVYFSVNGVYPYKAMPIDKLNDQVTLLWAPDSVTLGSVTYEVEPWNNYKNGAQVANFVDRLYTILLGRKAEMKGLEDWAVKLLEGQSEASTIVQGIAGSGEFASKNLSNEAIVERMYNSMLDRPSDAGGKADWVGRLNNGMSISAIINGFSGSEEFGKLCNNYGIKPGSIELGENRDKNPQVTAFAARCYTKALNRSFDVGGLNDWTGKLLNKEQSPESVAHGFVFSNEFTNRNLSNEEFVDTMYALCFDRAADSAGKNDWLQRMSQGASREDVFNGFAKSAEFANLVASFGL